MASVVEVLEAFTGDGHIEEEERLCPGELAQLDFFEPSALSLGDKYHLL